MTAAERCCGPVSENCFNEDTAYQGRDMEIRKISKENEDKSENNKTDT